MSALFVKGISSELSDNDIRDMLTNHCLFGTIDKVIVKRPKHLSNHSIYFINAIVYFQHISLERFGQRNIDSLNQGGFIKIIYCQSTPSAPARYWKAFKYEDDRSRIMSTNNNNNNRLDTNNGHHNGAVAPGLRETVPRGRNVTLPRDLRGREVAKPELLRLPTGTTEFSRSPTTSTYGIPARSKYVPIVEKQYVNLMNTVVLRKYPAPTIQNTQTDTDDEDELCN